MNTVGHLGGFDIGYIRDHEYFVPCFRLDSSSPVVVLSIRKDLEHEIEPYMSGFVRRYLLSPYLEPYERVVFDKLVPRNWLRPYGWRCPYVLIPDSLVTSRDPHLSSVRYRHFALGWVDINLERFAAFRLPSGSWFRRKRPITKSVLWKSQAMDLVNYFTCVSCAELILDRPLEPHEYPFGVDANDLVPA